jgi:phage FluMu gp28-like protein
MSFSGEQQEWCGELEDTVVKTFTGTRSIAAEDRRFIVGLDLAKSVDYTVLLTMDIDSGEVVYYRRLNKMDYRNVLEIATEVCRRFNGAELIFDATGVGAGLADILNNYDVTAHPFVFTNESKNEIVNKLALSIQYQEIKIPNITTIKNELSVFSYAVTRTGKISYAAPAGFHDDIVMSLALANWFRKENAGSDEIGIIEDILAINEERGSRFRPGSFREFMDGDND